MKYYRSHIMICVDPECLAKGALAIRDRLQEELASQGLSDEIQVLETPRIGGCANVPELMVYPDEVHYAGLTVDDIPYLVEEHFLKGRVVERQLAPVQEQVDEELGPPKPKEVRVVLRNCGKIDPENIEDYIAENGYQALGKVLSEMTPEQVVEEVLASGLRGRGGAGFPAGKKWQLSRAAEGSPKYIICNADEGDPGAFMNRRVLEGDPHSVIEGMIIAAYVIGASRGYIYCRAEYPLAVQTLNIAIQQARAFGLLGENILGSGFSFDLEVHVGAGAFVCGEETALMASIEGRRGEPRPRPPFPAVKGLWGKPTNINNVETYVNVPQIILKGAAWFASMGTEKSQGTRTFAIAGDVNNTGLIEVPLGITLREVIFDVGEGIKDDKRFKAVQIGGPMGGCLPAEYLDKGVDYESLTAAGAMMGSGGLVVMDEETCMVDIARFFMEFIQDESCGKCTPCRVGTRIETNRASTVKVGQALETTFPGVFAAGDCVSGPATVIEAVAQGNKVAMVVDAWLTTGKVDRIVYQPKRHDVAKFGEPALLSDELHRVSPRMLPPEWRSAGGFSEAELGFDEATVQAEAWRCLRCDLEWLERVGEPIPERKQAWSVERRSTHHVSGGGHGN